jgi:acyl-CoA thioesterase
MTGHYLSPTAPGPAALAVETIKEGRQLSTAAVALSQDGRERARFLVTCGTLDAPGPTHVDAAPPPLPPVEQAYKPPPDAPLPEVARRFDQRFDPTAMAWATRAPKAGPVELRAWVRFADGRDADARSLLLFADALPPPSLAILPPGWVPTVELTVHVRARPAPGWLRARFRTRFVQGGYLEEDGELWDETGRLVALSRQLAATPRGPSPLQPPVTP